MTGGLEGVLGRCFLVGSVVLGVYRFPNWHLVQETKQPEEKDLSRRLVPRKALDEKGRFDGLTVVPTRFVRACPRGHLDDVDWRRFVHGADDDCKRLLWLDEPGTGGDLVDLVARCECKKSRRLSDAAQIEELPLGACNGNRPWLGPYSSRGLPARLLIRTAVNAYFPQMLSVLSLPDQRTELEQAVTAFWEDLSIVDDQAGLELMKKKQAIAQALASYEDGEILEAIASLKEGVVNERPVKEVELEAVLGAEEGFGEDVPIDENFTPGGCPTPRGARRI